MLRVSVIRRVMRQREALGLNPLGGDSEEDRERRLDAARDRAFAAVTGKPKRQKARQWPAPGEVDQEFREAKRRRA